MHIDNLIDLEQRYHEFDQLGLEHAPDETVAKFVVREGAFEFRTYVALWVDDRWFVTGREAPNGVETEDLLAWLIGKGVRAHDLTFLEPVL